LNRDRGGRRGRRGRLRCSELHQHGHLSVADESKNDKKREKLARAHARVGRRPRVRRRRRGRLLSLH
jgi:hypothetical protein